VDREEVICRMMPPRVRLLECPCCQMVLVQKWHLGRLALYTCPVHTEIRLYLPKVWLKSG
jgi:hypothetical protein